MQIVFCNSSSVFNCTELYLSLLLVVPEVLHNSTVIEERLGRTRFVKGLKRTSKLVFDVVIQRILVWKYERENLNSIPSYARGRREKEKMNLKTESPGRRDCHHLGHWWVRV